MKTGYALLYSPLIEDLEVASQFECPFAKNIITNISLFRIRHDMAAIQAYFAGDVNSSDIGFLDWLLGYGEFSGTSQHVLPLCHAWIRRHEDLDALHAKATSQGLSSIAKAIEWVTFAANTSLPGDVNNLIQSMM